MLGLLMTWFEQPGSLQAKSEAARSRYLAALEAVNSRLGAWEELGLAEQELREVTAEAAASPAALHAPPPRGGASPWARRSYGVASGWELRLPRALTSALASSTSLSQSETKQLEITVSQFLSTVVEPAPALHKELPVIFVLVSLLLQYRRTHAVGDSAEPEALVAMHELLRALPPLQRHEQAIAWLLRAHAALFLPQAMDDRLSALDTFVSSVAA